MALQVVEASKNRIGQRTIRRPKGNSWNMFKLTELAPMYFHPVLPGETLVEASWKFTVRTPSMTSSFYGMHLHQYLFYVPLSAMTDIFSTLEDMVLVPGTSVAGIQNGAEVPDFFEAKGAIPYHKEAYEAIIKKFFRHEGEAIGSGSPGFCDRYDSVKLNRDNIFHSLAQSGEVTELDQVLDLDASGSITVAEMHRAEVRYMQLVAQGLTDMTYEDWLRSYGVQVPNEIDVSTPEFLRYIRTWSEPNRLIEPSTGAESAICQWAVDSKADKNRFFREPGFLVLLFAVTPKFYPVYQSGSLSGFMDDHQYWLPKAALADPLGGWRKFTHISGTAGAAGSANGPLDHSDEAYAMDIKDLLVRGEDQFFYTPQVNTTVPSYTTISWDYMGETMCDLFFGTNKFIGADGRVQFTIKTSVTDTTVQAQYRAT